MELPSDIPLFIDVEQRPNFDKQNILASILKESQDNEAVGQQQMLLTEERQSPAQVPAPQEPSKQAQKKARIRCPECHRFTADCEEKMIRHIRKIHRGENPFQCTMCQYSTYNKSLFEEHERIHKGIKPFKCAYCPYRSVSKKNKNKHENIHRKNNPLRCDLCPFIAHHYRSLLCHKLKHEDGEIPTKQNHKQNDEGGIKCDVCSYSFPSSIALQRHKNHSPKECEVCDDKFCSPYYLKKHMATVHDVRKESFKCQVCGWVGAVKLKVLLHLIHHPEQPVDEILFNVSVLKKHGIMK